MSYYDHTYYQPQLSGVSLQNPKSIALLVLGIGVAGYVLLKKPTSKALNGAKTSKKTSKISASKRNKRSSSKQLITIK